MFEEKIAEYLKPCSPNQEVLEDLTARVGRRMTQEPYQPEYSIAGPAMQQCIWADEWMLERYANLLASSMDAERRRQVHPSFVSVVGQMDQLDGAFLRELCKQVTMGVANCYLCKTKKDGTFGSRQVEIKSTAIKMIQRMTLFLPDDGDYARVQAAIDNLIRLQLIEVHMSSERLSLTEIEGDVYENIYLMFEPVIQKTVEEFRERFPKYQGGEVRMSTGNIVLTAFGGRFVRTCLV